MSTLVVSNLSLGAGGLPNGSVLTDDIADNAITGPKIAAGSVYADNLFGSQSGLAPIFGARAWVNFNGTGTVAIRGSGNVSSITDNGTGDYTVNFTTALPTEYAVNGGGTNSVVAAAKHFVVRSGTSQGTATLRSTTQCRMISTTSDTAFDCAELHASFFG